MEKEYLLKSSKLTWEYIHVLEKHFGPLVINMSKRNDIKEEQSDDLTVKPTTLRNVLPCTSATSPFKQHGHGEEALSLYLNLSHLLSVKVVLRNCEIERDEGKTETENNGAPESTNSRITKPPRVLRKTRERIHTCTICQKSFCNKTHLEIHRRIHTGDKPHKCPVCHKAFTQSGSMKRHLLVHSGAKPYSCNVCSAGFSRSANLKRHVVVVHDKVKKYSCDICHKSFTQKKHLSEHRNLHTGDRPYECMECQETFSQKSSLQYHIITHTDTKPYLCHVCEKKFACSSNLKAHLRTHSGSRPFVCSYAKCSKAFAQKSSLTIHLRTHSEERPFSCDVCQKTFKSRLGSMTHIKRCVLK